MLTLVDAKLSGGNKNKEEWSGVTLLPMIPCRICIDYFFSKGQPAL